MLEPGYTPDLEEVIRLGIDQRLFDLQTALPGEVVDYDKATQTATVQPSIQRSYGGKLVNLPALQKVPVYFPRAGAWKLTGPIKAGDTGQLIFCSRSIDIWKKQGGIVDPKDTRKFHITDAMFYPGTGPYGKSIPTQDTAHFRLENGDARIELQEAGKFRFEKVGGDEILDLLIQITAKLEHIAEKLGTTTTNTMLGPQQLMDFADFTATKGEITTLKGKLTALKG